MGVFNMGNEFIDYLNSMNNATSANENALAESQVLSEYYSKIKVERKVGNQIYERLFSGKPRSVILTGHAGDGKTSLLVQILDKIGCNKGKNNPLKEVEVVIEDKKLFYVKDMSELNQINQEKYLIEFLESPKKGISSLLITNTGPLINTFKRIIKNNNGDSISYSDDIERFEVEFLDCIDKSCTYDKEFNIQSNKYNIDIINIAQIDNAYFIGEIIEKLCQESLWSKCISCSIACENKCHIYNNYLCISRQKERIKDMLERIYFWLNESESRLTIRQMLSHISYSITGNVSCKEINNKIVKQENQLFVYSFANLFFGYHGTELAKDSLNIKAIRELNRLELDKKPLLKQDNRMFVKEDFSNFYKDISNTLENELERNLLSLGLDNKNSQNMRRAFRRYFILLNNNEEEDLELLKEIFSEVYPMYYKLVNEQKLTRSLESQIIDIIFHGLYKLFTGVSVKGNESGINLTLRKNLDEIQSVQIVLGNFTKENIEIEVRKQKSIEKSIKNNSAFIKIGNVEYEITHEALYYLFKLQEGVIFTSYNPNFTFGISKLKSDIIKEFKRNKNDIRLLIIKKDKIEKIEMYLDEGILNACLGRW